MQEKTKPLLLHTTSIMPQGTVIVLSQWNQHSEKWMKMLQGDDDHGFMSIWSQYKPVLLLSSVFPTISHTLTAHSTPSFAQGTSDCAVAWGIGSELKLDFSPPQARLLLAGIRSLMYLPAQLHDYLYSDEGGGSTGAGVRILLQNDSLKSRCERMVYTHARSLTQALMYKSHPCSELTQTTPCPEAVQRQVCNRTWSSDPSSSWERGGPHEAARSARQPDSAREHSAIRHHHHRKGLTGRGGNLV